LAAAAFRETPAARAAAAAEVPSPGVDLAPEGVVEVAAAAPAGRACAG
jgi:hypothetical protein